MPALFVSRDHRSQDPVAVSTGKTFETLPVVATAVPGSSHVVVLGPSDIAAAAATTTTTTAPPPPTTVKRRVIVKATPTTVRRAVRPKAVVTTTTTAKPRPKPKATTTTTPAPDGTESGKASWYDHEAGICAHKSLPFGTVVTVTNVANGRSVRCTVGDRGPYVDGWIIDLNPREFEQLAPRSEGVISVRISW